MAAAGVWACCHFCMDKKGGKEVDEVVASMDRLIPGLSGGNRQNTGNGRDPLAALSIDGLDVVGCLEVPTLDIKVPVLSKGVKKDGFVTWESGSPVSGAFRLTGDRNGVFRDIDDADPGAQVYFTDIDGVCYSYKVSTQYHLKDWSEADNDLLLCYRVDDDTVFVLGCMYDFSN